MAPHKFTRDQITFVLNATGSTNDIAAAYHSHFGVAIVSRTVQHLKDSYGPSKPIPTQTRGGFTREQIEFVMASTEPHSHIAKEFNVRFNPSKPVTHRQIRHLQQLYGTRPLPKEGYKGRKIPTTASPFGYEASFQVSVPGAAVVPGPDALVKPAVQEAPARFTQSLPPLSFPQEAMPTDPRGQNLSAEDLSPAFQPFPSTSAHHPDWMGVLYADAHYPAEQPYATSDEGHPQAQGNFQQAAHWDAGNFQYTDYHQQDGYGANEIGGYPDELGQQDGDGADEFGGHSDDPGQQEGNVMQQHDRRSGVGEDGVGMSVIDGVVPLEM